MEKFIANLFSDDGVVLLLYFAGFMLFLTIGGIWVDRAEKRKQYPADRSMASPRRN